MSGQRGDARPVEPVDASLSALFMVVSSMENDLLSLKDLGHAVMLLAESENIGLADHAAGALARLGLYIVASADVAESKRRETMGVVHSARRA